MAWAIHVLGPVGGPLLLKAAWAGGGYGLWRLGRWAAKEDAAWRLVAAVIVLLAVVLWYATVSNLCVLVSGWRCFPAVRL